MKKLSPISIAAITVAAVLGLLLLGEVLFKLNLGRLIGKNQDDELIDPNSLGSSIGNTGIGSSFSYCRAAGPPNCYKVLKEGVVGLEVCRLQQWLNQNPGRRGSIAEDGIFGPETRRALFEQTQFSEVQLSVLNAC